MRTREYRPRFDLASTPRNCCHYLNVRPLVLEREHIDEARRKLVTRLGLAQQLRYLEIAASYLSLLAAVTGEVRLPSPARVRLVGTHEANAGG